MKTGFSKNQNSRRPHRLLMWTLQSWRRVRVLRVRRRCLRHRHHWCEVRSKLECVCVCAEAVGHGAQVIHHCIGTRVKPLFTTLLFITVHWKSLISVAHH